MSPQSFTLSDLLAWIAAQPDDRPVDMFETDTDDECGCVLVQFARDKGIVCHNVGFDLNGTLPFTPTYHLIHALIENHAYTFRNVKATAAALTIETQPNA